LPRAGLATGIVTDSWRSAHARFYFNMACVWRGEALRVAAPAGLHLLNDAYEPIHAASQKELDKAIKDNGLGD
jgi:hypothetical protein